MTLVPADRKNTVRHSAIRCSLAIAAITTGACFHVTNAPDAGDALVGAWRSAVRFESGAFATIEDLEFMYVFNAGGTLTESSNYDGAPPVPPAYGVWRRIGPNQFEARYEYYITKPPAHLEDLATGGGWMPAGRGVFTEHIRIEPGGRSYTSTIHYEAFDTAGNLVEGGGDARGRAQWIGF